MSHYLGIKDLGPEGDSLDLKFRKNFFMGENNNGQIAVALRIARVNHACRPNAATIFDETAQVAILFAQQDIQPGEEICICYYYPFFRLDSDVRTPAIMPQWNTQEEFTFLKTKSLSIYGITCPVDCSCHDPANYPALVEEGRQIQATIIDLAYHRKAEEALEAGEKLLDIHRRLNVSWVYRGYAYFNLFHTAVMKWETLPRAKEYIQSAVNLFRNICPNSERLTKKCEKLLEHPDTNPFFMAIDRMQPSDFMEFFRNGVNL